MSSKFITFPSGEILSIFLKEQKNPNCQISNTYVVLLKLTEDFSESCTTHRYCKGKYLKRSKFVHFISGKCLKKGILKKEIQQLPHTS